MKKRGMRMIAAGIVCAAAVLLNVAPTAARPRDPDGFKTEQKEIPNCDYRASFGDPPAVDCGPPPATTHVSWSPAEARALTRNAAAAIRRAGTLHYALDMETTTTSITGNSWQSASTLVGDYAAPDRLHGMLTITSPWATTQSEVTIANGQVRITHPQTGQSEDVLKLATGYYPVIFTGCLLRMAEADMGRLELVGMEMLDGESVYHLKGLGGAGDKLEIEYWLSVEEGLPRQATARSGELPGWSDEARTIRITATLRLPVTDRPEWHEKS